MQMFIPLSQPQTVSPSQNKFLLFLETHLSLSLSLLRHEDFASEQVFSVSVLVQVLLFSQLLLHKPSGQLAAGYLVD